MEIRSNSPNTCWEKTMDYLLEYGKENILYQREYIMATNITYVLDRVEEEKLHDKYLISDMYKRSYSNSFGINNTGIELKRIYQYGKSKVNQYELAKEAILSNDSYRVPVITVQYPEEDYQTDGYPKCLLDIHFIRDNDKISAVCNYLSSNMAIFNLIDIYLLHNIHAKMAEDTNYKIGELVIHFDRVFIWKLDLLMYRRL